VGCYREAEVDIARGWGSLAGNLVFVRKQTWRTRRVQYSPMNVRMTFQKCTVIFPTPFYVDHVSQFLTTRTVSGWCGSRTRRPVQICKPRRPVVLAIPLRLVISPQLVNSVLSKTDTSLTLRADVYHAILTLNCSKAAVHY
jgi:hypothetical protein